MPSQLVVPIFSFIYIKLHKGHLKSAIAKDLVRKRALGLHSWTEPLTYRRINIQHFWTIVLIINHSCTDRKPIWQSSSVKSQESLWKDPRTPPWRGKEGMGLGRVPQHKNYCLIASEIIATGLYLSTLRYVYNVI